MNSLEALHAALMALAWRLHEEKRLQVRSRLDTTRDEYQKRIDSNREAAATLLKLRTLLEQQPPIRAQLERHLGLIGPMWDPPEDGPRAGHPDWENLE